MSDELHRVIWRSKVRRSKEELSGIFPWMDEDKSHAWKNDIRAYLRALENPREEIPHLITSHIKCHECLEMYEKALTHIQSSLVK